MFKNPEYGRFIIRNTIRGLLYFVLMIGIFIGANTLIPENWQTFLDPVLDHPYLVFMIFFLSETFFGIIPPEFFIMWAVRSTLGLFIFKVALLSALSFLGAFIAFYVGTLIRQKGVYDKLLKSRFSKYVGYYQRYGGVIIILSSLTPLPFATISLISATLGFGFKRYCLFALTRFLRFIIYGLVFWKGDGWI